MPISGNWKKDKSRNLNSLEDFSLIYFNEADYIDKARTIMASFENFTSEDITSSGNIIRSYDSDEELSIDNFEGLVYYDVAEGNRIVFKVESSDFAGHSNGNVPQQGELVNIISTIPNFNGDYMVYKSEDIIITYTNNVDGEQVLTQIPGRIWLSDTLDHPENGVNWDSNWLDLINNVQGYGQWRTEQEAWTDSDTTINKAVFWQRDDIAPQTN